jgi:hypothetical protein
MLTWNVYQADNNTQVPANLHSDNPSNPAGWVDGSVHGPTFGFTNATAFTDPKRALFAPYLRDIEVYNCPAEKTYYTVNRQKVKKLRSYSMNDFMNGHMNAQGLRFYKKGDEIRDGSKVFVFIDTEPWSNCWTPFEIPSKGQRFFHAPSILHGGSGVISYADGRSESHKWKQPVNRKRPDDSPHDSMPSAPLDVTWIRARAHHLLDP